MNIDELPKLLKQIEDRSAEKEAFKSLLAELQQVLTDLLEHQEKTAPALATAIADALKSIRLTANPTVNVAAPTVNVAPPAVHVAAPHVTVQPQINLPAADVKAKDCDIEFVYGAGGFVTSAKVRYT